MTGTATSGISIRAPEGQGVTFVELFFDLVFVFAVTEVTKLTASDLTWGGVGRSVVVFWLIWWAWTQFTWSLNPADTNHGAVRVGVLAATALAFLMALGVSDAFTDDGGMWFAVSYVLVRLLGIGLNTWVVAEDIDQLSAVAVFFGLSLLGLAAVLIGAAVDGDARAWWWLAVIVLDLVAAGIAGTRAGWELHVAHFAERHGLFVIIVLGESLIAAGVAAAGEERTGDLVFVAVAAVVLTSLLWWTYFGWLKDSLEDGLEEAEGMTRTLMARDAYSVLHFPLIGGVVGIAIGIEEMVAHPDEVLHGEVLAAFVAGLILFVGSAAVALWRVRQRVLVARPAILALVAAALALAHPAGPRVVFTTAIIGVLAIVVYEAVPRGLSRGSA